MGSSTNSKGMGFVSLVCLMSEEAAKESLIYVYKNAAMGFSAKLTPDQVSEIQKQPGVLQVVVSQQLQMHKPVM
ncbi:Subtilisin-like protease SBT3.17 [Bienertia sinuspersici]